MNESKYQFQKGDRVVIVKDHPDGNPDLVCGMTGTVVAGPTAGRRAIPWFPVDWDREIVNGHDCSGNARNRHGWNTQADYIDFCVSEADDEIDAAPCQSVLDFLCS